MLCFTWEARWPHSWCARLRSERSGFEPWPGTLCCVLRQDTLLSQCLSPPRCTNGYQRIVGENLTICGGVTCDGLASRPGEVEILPAASCYRNRDKLRHQWALWPLRLRFLFRFCFTYCYFNAFITYFHKCKRDAKF